MSTWTHCDNKDCDQMRDRSKAIIRRLCEPGWIELVDEAGQQMDFHNATCLAAHLSPLLEVKASA